MFAWSSVGNSNYNALQATLRKQFGGGFIRPQLHVFEVD